MMEVFYDAYDYEPGAGGSLTVDPASSEVAPSYENSVAVPVVEYDPKDLQPILKHPSYKDLEEMFNFKGYTNEAARKVQPWNKSFAAIPKEDGLMVNICQDFDDHDSYHLQAMLVAGAVKEWCIISPAFQEVLEVTTEHIVVRAGDRILQYTEGRHKSTARQVFEYDYFPRCLNTRSSVLISDITPPTKALNKLSDVISPTADTDNWQVLDVSMPETCDLAEKQRYSNELFKASVKGVFTYVRSHHDKYPELSDRRAPIHLPSLSVNGRYYQLSTISNERGTTINIQRVQPGSDSDSIADALARISSEEFSELVNDPEKLEALFNEALAEGQLLVTQVPSGEIMIIGGDNFEKRLEPKDKFFTPLMKQLTELIKTYLEELECLPENQETLFDLRTELANDILTLQAGEKQPASRLKRFGIHLLSLFSGNY